MSSLDRLALLGIGFHCVCVLSVIWSYNTNCKLKNIGGEMVPKFVALYFLIDKEHI